MSDRRGGLQSLQAALPSTPLPAYINQPKTASQSYGAIMIPIIPVSTTAASKGKLYKRQEHVGGMNPQHVFPWLLYTKP
jgi:hypothetical protein